MYEYQEKGLPQLIKGDVVILHNNWWGNYGKVIRVEKKQVKYLILNDKFLFKYNTNGQPDINKYSISIWKCEKIDIDIDDAGNDCIDFSSGEYKVTHSTLNKCRDKAISIGEKTVSFFKNVNISNSNIGIASKDSSIATINNANFKNTALCLSAYNKKQEFWGGKIIVDGINCPLDKIFQEKNSIIEVSM